jgi:hypothetical protein
MRTILLLILGSLVLSTSALAADPLGGRALGVVDLAAFPLSMIPLVFYFLARRDARVRYGVRRAASPTRGS